MKQATFIKTLERDSTLIMQVLFARAMSEDLERAYGFKSPHTPLIIHYATEDNIQIWENEAMVEWLCDLLLQENRKGTDFMRQVIEAHAPIEAEAKECWNREPSSDPEVLLQFLPLIRRGMLGVLTCFYAGIDERTPKAVQELVIAMRKDDELFARGSTFVKESLMRIGFREDLAHLVLPHEIVPKVEESELEKRTGGAVLVDGMGLSLSRLEAFADAHPEYEFPGLSEKAQAVSEVRGQTASRGSARGKVRIVKNQRQARLVAEGDVIISPMTTPDFVDAMKRASAFVTDEGGVVCHAAVVAREMKKPCIIGTKIATKAFTDGDMVEVDGDAGVVRKA